MEKKNIITGIALITFFLAMGAFLEIQLGAGPEWKTSMRHSLWKSAHFHGIGFGILNILYAFLLKNYMSHRNPGYLGSWLAVGGAILPLGLFLAGIQKEFQYIIPVGGFSMLLAWLTMGYGVLIKK